MKKILLLVIVLCFTPIGAYANNTHWAYDEIHYLCEKNYIAEKEAANLLSDDYITRKDFFNLFISITLSKDIANVKGGLFSSQDKISRFNAIYILSTALKLEGTVEESFSDDTSFGGYKEYIQHAIANNIIKGYPDGSLKNGNLTKAEAGVILSRVAKLNSQVENLEVERKFLIDSKNVPFNLETAERFDIIQTYISVTPEIRVRKLNGSFYSFAIKLPRDESLLQRRELEYNINKDEYEYLMSKKESNDIHKIRYQFKYKNEYVAVDIYQDDLEGLAISEIEFESKEKADEFIPFDWYIKDVTSDKEYKNVSLATKRNPNK